MFSPLLKETIEYNVFWEIDAFWVAIDVKWCLSTSANQANISSKNGFSLLQWSKSKDIWF